METDAVMTPPNFREMRVVAVRDLTPGMRRITLAGADLARFDSHHLHVRLLFPPDGLAPGATPCWPRLNARGGIVWPDGRRKPDERKYTLRRVDVAAGTVDIDMVVHADTGGPGSAFAVNAKPGDAVGMAGPGGGGIGRADWYLLAGDETALPAIGRILEGLPPGSRGCAFIEVAGAAEEQPLARPPGIDLQWLHRNGAPAGTTSMLADAVSAAAGPDSGSGGTVFAWAAGEFEMFRAVRRHLREDRGLGKAEHLAVAYWRRGIADNPPEEH